MKAVILAGGLGTRISEESHLKPKPMIEIGDKPIIWHIMKMYSHYGINDFIICAGYKQHVIKEWFANYALHNSDMTFNFKDSTTTVHSNMSEPWTVTVVDTGLNTQTGGRIRKIKKYVDGETFCLTYGDGLSDINFEKLISFHNKGKRLVTLTAVHPEGRFGVLDMNDNDVVAFREKNPDDVGMINGGFMILEPGAFDYFNVSDDTSFEQGPLTDIMNARQLNAYKHYGFWQCMDTLRDRDKLQKLWESGHAPWKTW